MHELLARLTEPFEPKMITLTRGYVALVDEIDFVWLSQWKWRPHRGGNNFYAMRSVGTYPNKQQIFMHRVIIDAPAGVSVDHRDGNGLNNQRSNLRLCSHQENHFNRASNRGTSSSFKGVGWNKDHGKWAAYIAKDKKIYHLGFFTNEEDAARAYDIAARSFYGDFARLNLPEVNHE